MKGLLATHGWNRREINESRGRAQSRLTSNSYYCSLSFRAHAMTRTHYSYCRHCSGSSHQGTAATNAQL